MVKSKRRCAGCGIPTHPKDLVVQITGEEAEQCQTYEYTLEKIANLVVNDHLYCREVTDLLTDIGFIYLQMRAQSMIIFKENSYEIRMP